MKSRTNILNELNKVNPLNAQEKNFNVVLDLISSKSTPNNNFDFDKLNTKRIFHLDSIKKICIDFRLRFLDHKYFKNTLPKEAFLEISKLESIHSTLLSDFKIMAPSKLFRLKNTDDPLLFVPLGNNYFYLVHKWGNDLHPFRKLMMWPLKNLRNMVSFLLIVSFGLTYITPTSIFSKVESWSVFWMIYFFMFKAIASIVIFYAFALGKNFNRAIWNSKYNKSI
ncbi:MAG: hypothetical protein ACJ0PY_00275 [Flavobacteriaceae bacterium]|nr:hypothetical protein [Flavobacteriaceae bacterium]|tara:strand:- start:7073 stop:7744 length:672 start_codon:yes stop_codon:yes gene_type:complete